MITAWLSSVIIAVFALSASAGEEETTGVGGVPEQEARRLEALGYVDYSPKLPDLDRSGVTRFDPSLAAAGHTLVVSSIECAARLIDLSGNELHYWWQPACMRWWSAELLPNGDLVVDGGRRLPQASRNRKGGKEPLGRFVARISWKGSVVWMQEIRAHHQLDWTPSKEVLVLTELQRSQAEVASRAPELLSEADASIVFHDNALVWLSPDGEVRETLSLFDAVSSGDTEFGFLARDALLETAAHVGLFHANSAYAMDQLHLVGTHPLYSDQNVLVTSRNQNRIFVVDRQNRSLVWQWGRGVLEAPHCATWLANGHILVFDNGIERGTSRILEIDPTAGQVVWTYPDADGRAFHSETRGLAQRLANGNTLITNSQAGEAFEVTPTGAMVWQYFAPVLAEGMRRPVLMSLRRYPESWLAPLREGGANSVAP